MKKVILTALVAVSMCGCDEGNVKLVEETTGIVKFCINGDFKNPTFTRALTASGSEMKELWAFDFIDGECVNCVYQTSDDDDFGSPTLTMTNGNHTVCFVVSRGSGYTIDDGEHMIEWEKPSDTFWGSVTMDVSPASHETMNVELRRVATKLRISITDEVPDNLASVSVTPATWYYGLDYWTGEAVEPRANVERVLSVPDSYHGTTGQLAVSVFCISNAAEWTTDVTVTAKDANGGTISTVTIPDAPFMANRQTQYSGRMFGSSGAFTLTLDDDWQTEYTGTW